MDIDPWCFVCETCPSLTTTGCLPAGVVVLYEQQVLQTHTVRQEVDDVIIQVLRRNDQFSDADNVFDISNSQSEINLLEKQSQLHHRSTLLGEVKQGEFLKIN